MIRVQTYNTAPQSVRAPGIQQAALPTVGNVADTAGTRTLASLLDSGDKLMQVAAREYVKDETARVSQALQQMNADLAAERERYMQENQGQNAIDAGAHFESFATQLAQKYMQDGKFQGRFAEAFEKQAMGTVLHFTEQGRSYGNQQREAWNKSVLDGALSDFQNQVAQNYNNKDWIAYNLMNLEKTVNAMRPGLDNSALMNNVRKAAAQNIVDGYLAHDDIAGARQALNENRELLGDKVAAAEVQIRNRADALQAKAEAAAKRREEEAEKAFVQGTSADIISQLDQFPADWTVEQKEAKLVELTADIEDPKLRKTVRSLVKADLDDKELVRKAGVVEELGLLDRTFEQNPNMTPTEKLAMIRTSNFSEETKKAAEKAIMDAMDGKDNTAHSAAGLAAYRRWFDAMGGNVTADQEKAMMFDLGLNSKDRRAAEEYKGARLEYPQQHIFSLIDSVKGKGKVNETGKNLIYDAVIQEAKASGKALTDKEIKAIIFKQDVEGYVAGSEPGWFGRRPSMTYGDALRKGVSMGLFRPDVPEDTATQIKVRLEMEKPWMTLLTEDMRNALVQTVYLQEQFGIPLELSAEEREAFQNAIDAYNKRTMR